MVKAEHARHRRALGLPHTTTPSVRADDAGSVRATMYARWLA